MARSRRSRARGRADGRAARRVPADVARLRRGSRRSRGLALSRDGTRIVWSSCKEVHARRRVDAPRQVAADAPAWTWLAPPRWPPSRPAPRLSSSRPAPAKRAPGSSPSSGDTSPRAIGVGRHDRRDLRLPRRIALRVSVPDHGLQIGSLEGMRQASGRSRPVSRIRRRTSGSGTRQVVFTRRPGGRQAAADGRPRRRRRGRGAHGRGKRRRRVVPRGRTHRVPGGRPP